MTKEEKLSGVIKYLANLNVTESSSDAIRPLTRDQIRQELDRQVAVLEEVLAELEEIQ